MTVRKFKKILESALRILLMFLGFYSLYLGALWSFQRHLLFPAWGEYADMKRADLPERGEWWELKTPVGVVEAVFIPGKGVTPGNPGPAVILVHGNGDVVDRFTARSYGYLERGISVLMPEYRGYGRSAGSPSQEGLVNDAEAFLKRLKARPEVNPNAIYYHGHSMGGGITAALADREPPRGLVLESTFQSIRPFAKGVLAPGFLARDPFDTHLTLAGFKGPVFIVHGAKDGVIVLENAKVNHAAAPNSRLHIVPNGAHALAQDADYWAGVDWVLHEVAE